MEIISALICCDDIPFSIRLSLIIRCAFIVSTSQYSVTSVPYPHPAIIDAMQDEKALSAIPALTVASFKKSFAAFDT